MFTAYCFKLKPNTSQAEKMTNWLFMLRANYNFNLRDRIEAYEQVSKPELGNYSRLDNQGECCPLTCSVNKSAANGYPWKSNGKRRSAYEQQSSALPVLKKERVWYQKINSTVLQQNLKRLHTAFDKFFQGNGYPKFKSKSKFTSFSYSPGQVKVTEKENAVYLPGIGWMKYFSSRKIPTGFEIKTVTIRHKADGWHISLRLEDKTIPNVPKIKLGEVKTALGADLGINKLISLSNNKIVENPRFAQQLERRKSIRQRRASRKKKGSKNRSKAYQYLAKIDQKIVDQRQDYHWKIAHQLCRQAEILVFENLNIKGLLKKCQPKKNEEGKYLKNGRNAKKALSRLISDAAWGELKLKVQSVAEKLGRHYVEIDPKNSSRECHKCGHITALNRQKERFFCLECNHLEDSDTQAAKNILARGLKQLGVNPAQLPMVRRKVTATEISSGLPDEPSNPKIIKQLSLFDSSLWSAGSVMN
jgi:putative transposase